MFYLNGGWFYALGTTKIKKIFSFETMNDFPNPTQKPLFFSLQLTLHLPRSSPINNGPSFDIAPKNRPHISHHPTAMRSGSVVSWLLVIWITATTHPVVATCRAHRLTSRCVQLARPGRTAYTLAISRRPTTLEPSKTVSVRNNGSKL